MSSTTPNLDMVNPPVWTNYFLPTSSREEPSIIMAARRWEPKTSSGCIHQPDLLIAHVPQLLGKFLHIPIHPGLHLIVQRKHAALFQNPQRFHQKRPLVRSVDVVIHIVAYHGVKTLIRKIQMIGVAMLKLAPGRHAFTGGISLHMICP